LQAVEKIAPDCPAYTPRLNLEEYPLQKLNMEASEESLPQPSMFERLRRLDPVSKLNEVMGGVIPGHDVAEVGQQSVDGLSAFDPIAVPSSIGPIFADVFVKPRSPFAELVENTYSPQIPGSGSRLVSVGTALTNFRLAEVAKRVGRNKIPLPTIKTEAAQAIFDREKLDLKEKGIDFFSNFYVPEVDLVTGKNVFAIEDPPHKLKNCKSSINNQRNVNGEEALLLDKGVLERVARSDARFAHLVPIIIGSVDSQNVPAARELFCNLEFQEALEKAGHDQEALLLFVLGNDFQAWDRRHLTLYMRDVHTLVYNDVVYNVFGRYLSMLEFLTKAKFGGFPRDQLLARMANNDARQQYMKEIGEAQSIVSLCLQKQWACE
jgi:hypothetical protein